MDNHHTFNLCGSKYNDDPFDVSGLIDKPGMPDDAKEQIRLLAESIERRKKKQYWTTINMNKAESNECSLLESNNFYHCIMIYDPIEFEVVDTKSFSIVLKAQPFSV